MSLPKILTLVGLLGEIGFGFSSESSTVKGGSAFIVTTFESVGKLTP